MKISQLVIQYSDVLPIGCVLTDEQITRSLRDAVRQYCGYARLVGATSTDGIHSDIDETETADGLQDLDLTPSELAIVRPLWLLYIEKENALALEASRSQGADPFGRSAAEAQGGIDEYHQRLPALCFNYQPVSI